MGFYPGEDKIMKIYVAGVLNKWNSLTSVDGDTAIKLDGTSIGFMAVFATYEDCKEEFPDRDVIEMETVG
jgi:hypothetical protein